jgi:hypothetical protein
MKKKKAQAEIFGIAIVIVVLVLVAVLFIGLKLREKPSTIKKSASYMRMSSDFVNAMIKTTTPCDKVSLHDLIVDCAAGKFIKCGADDSCVYARKVSEEILKNTFGPRADEYLFKVEYSGSALFEEINTSKAKFCSPSVSASVPISTGRENIDISIKLCS